MLEVIDGFDEQRPDHSDKGDIFTLEDASLRAVQGSKNNTVCSGGHSTPGWRLTPSSTDPFPPLQISRRTTSVGKMVPP